MIIQSTDISYSRCSLLSAAVACMMLVFSVPLTASPGKKGPGEHGKRAGKMDHAHRGEKHMQAFRERDTNGDGFLSFEEFGQMERLSRLPVEDRKKIFAYLDKNQDGKLHRSELYPSSAPSRFGKLLKHFDRLDSDASGGLSVEELRNVPMFRNASAEQLERLFRKIDRNKNQQLERHELSKAEPKVDPSIHFEKHDVDKSGGLSFEEYSSMPFMNKMSNDRRRKIFERIDLNKDQQLSPEEIKKTKPRRRDHHLRKPGGNRRDKGRNLPANI